MRLNKDDIYSLIGTVAFHGVILLILWFTVLKTEVPDEDGGVLVNFGNVDAAAGMGKNRLRKRPLPLLPYRSRKWKRPSRNSSLKISRKA